MKKRQIVLFAFLCCALLKTGAQEFFNLSAEDISLNTHLPVFTHSIQLGEHFQYTDYEVTIEYPEFMDMSEADVQRYHELCNDSLPELPRINTQLSIDRKQGILDISLMPLVCRDGHYQKLVSFKLAVEEKPRARVMRSSEAAERYTSESVLAKGSWAKIRVPASGVYQLTSDVVRQAGFSDINKVKIYGYGGALQPEILSGDYLRETDDLKQVPQCIVNGKHLFYAQGPVTWSNTATRIRNPYSNYGYYFITENEEQVLTVDSAAFVGSFYPSDDFRNTIYEVDDYAWYDGGRNLYDSRLISDTEASQYTLQAANPSEGGRLFIMLTADTPSPATSSAEITLNGESIGKATVSKRDTYGKAKATKSTLSLPTLTDNNKITIKKLTGNNMRLDYMVLQTNAYAPAPSLSTASFPAAEYVYRITNQNMHGHGPVDMVIIIPTTQKLKAQAERLKAIHEKYDSLSVRIVPADELFNEFSSGTPDATAYKRYMKMLYDRAETADDAPKYLLLFGDGAWDNRMLTTAWRNMSPDDYLLCYESENSYDEVYCFVSDDFFCMLDDQEAILSGDEMGSNYRGKADVAVGRFPVRNETEAKIMVDKVETYLNKSINGAWQNTLVFMGDDGNNNIHMIAADAAAKIVEEKYPSYEVRRIFWDAYTRESSSTGNRFPEVENLVKQYIKEGALIMDYNGHGTTYCLSHEQSILLSYFKNDNSGKMPLWITASCDVMPFDGQEDNIGEVAVLNPNGGAIAFYGTTRTVLSTQNKLMNNAFISRVLSTENGGVGIGEAVRTTKNALVEADGTPSDLTVNKLQYTLLGDPAVKLATPRLSMVVDSINGEVMTAGNTIEMKAGMAVKVSGHVERNGVADDSFTGLLNVKVKDAIETITCKLNNTSDDGAKTPYVFQDRTSNIFKGQDSIRQGKFTFTFAVPKDIRYEDGAGQILLYGTSEDKSLTAHGDNESVIFKGTGDLNCDSVGPSVFCYLNSTSFRNGDQVNSTPYFVAEIRDEDGINAAGSGIGHDMRLIIDDDVAMTYNLNDYFMYDFGTHQSGRVGFSLPELPLGQHKVSFRVWDILNNSTYSELTFRVTDGLRPNVFDIQCTKNPAVNSTSFVVSHDRIGSEVDVTLELFDMSGRILWANRQRMTPAESTLTVDWNLTIDGGRTLGTGVYLYRVRLTSDGNTRTSKAKKLIVISNN